MRKQFAIFASYNSWMNAKLYQAASELSAGERSADKGAFFGSVFGTLNHIAVADRIWLQRFAAHSPGNEVLADVRLLPTPQSLREVLFADFKQLSEHRVALDAIIERWVKGLADSDLDQVVYFATIRGVPRSKRLSSLLLHFFNHQTHHRGQVTTLLSQFGKDVGVTDLLAMLPDDEQA